MVIINYIRDQAFGGEVLLRVLLKAHTRLVAKAPNQGISHDTKAII